MSITQNKKPNTKKHTNRQNKKPITDLNGSFKVDDTPYIYPDDRWEILGEFTKISKVYSKYEKDLGAVYYWNCPCSLDTETSSLYINGEKIAVMYVWMFSLNGKVIVGRTWEEFNAFMKEIQMRTDLKCRLICYVHNLGFDFSFFCRRLEWYKTFCLKVREPIYAITTGGLEFRDSYILTNKSLAASAKDLLKYKVEKQVGDLDYKLIRGSKTPLTDKEMKYCIYDCLVLDCIIQEKIEQEGSIARIPLTNTGYVRRFLKQKCYPGTQHSSREVKKEKRRFRDLIEQLTITPEEYSTLKRAFMGGFTHANAHWVEEKISGRIDSFDFTSSYPAVILSEMFPMSKATHMENVSRETFEEILKTKLSIFDVTFYDLETKDEVPDHYISKSKCKSVGEKIDNGRIVSAKKLTTTVTNIDFEIIRNTYDCSSYSIGEILVYEKGYLPKSIIEGVLELYKAKTELKGVVGMEVDYLIKKGMLNSVYGCMVTDIIKELTEYSGGQWDITKPDAGEALEKYNKSKSRFLYYPWGVFITAYARRNLWTGILEFGNDYIYSDTDSIKCLNVMKHMQYVTWYNTMITKKVETVLDYYDIDRSEAAPKTIKGVPKPIGVWDHETKDDYYKEFKTLGAKRYMYEQSDGIHITVAGLGKTKGGEYISSKDKPFEFFSDKMNVPESDTGKLLHSYIDKETQGTFIDYMGIENEFHELGGVHLEPTFYTLSLDKGFKRYLDEVRDGDENYGIG